MDQIEARELRRASEEIIRIYDQDHRFTETDIRKMHQIWLGSIYVWPAGIGPSTLSKLNFLSPRPGKCLG
ncbi:MAG: hypothetical protein HYU33_05830 [Candidatus Omnitrophica bacterium]|nr:hypothetical protein [Candidatus Omnitrophota bacterium]